MKTRNPEIQAQIVELYQSGLSLAQVGRKVGLKGPCIAYHLRNAGVKIRSVKEGIRLFGLRNPPPLPIVDLVAIYEEGWTLQAMAAGLHYPEETLRRNLKNAGCKMRPRGHVPGRYAPVEESGDYIYRSLPDHPYSNSRGYYLEHRIVMERHIGRYLDPEEVVHHKNGKRDDNRLENLQLFANDREHALHHWTEWKKLQQSLSQSKALPKVSSQEVSKTDDEM